VADVPNILILPDGFTADEQGDFERLVRQLVHRLRVRRRTRPYDLLKDRINYFTAWVASAEKGGSMVEEVETVGPVTGRTTGRCAPTMVAPARTAAAWHVGAPGQNTTRLLLNERSTAFHVALGGRPNAAGTLPFRWPRLNDRQRLAES